MVFGGWFLRSWLHADRSTGRQASNTTRRLRQHLWISFADPGIDSVRADLRSALTESSARAARQIAQKIV
jgi:hypothetical protein